MDLETWRARLITERHGKDVAFRDAPWSPIRDDERAFFEGLSYYDPDPRYRFVAVLNEEPSRDDPLPLSDGGSRAQRRVGTFALVLPTGSVRLAAFETAGGDGGLFVPFLDATSGTETFDGGRYLEAHRRRDGRYVVDFNRAHHPYCAYGPDHVCPLPPRENRLDVPVPAGERLPQAEPTRRRPVHRAMPSVTH